MAKNGKKFGFFELLVENDKTKIHEHIIHNGKSKSICPIRFFTEDEEVNKNDKVNEK